MSTQAEAALSTYDEVRRVSPVPDFAKIDTREAAATNWAELMTRLDGLGFQLQRAFVLLEERTQQMLEQGTRAEPVLQTHVQAALVAWQANRQGEAPIGRPIP